MRPEATPLFSSYERSSSCVLETRFSVVGLYVVVEAYAKGAAQAVHVEVFFPYHNGFVLLDEGDMPLWLGAECFRTGHLLYEVRSGGWFTHAGEQTGLLAIASGSCREWLVVTANECVSVFSAAEPIVRELFA